MNTFKIEKKVLINSPVEMVFDALTNSKEIPKYYPLLSVVSEWNEGNEVLYKGEINGAPFTDFGVIEEISKPNIYRYRYWSDNHGTERTEENHLTIEYKVSPTADGSEVKVTQSNIKSKEMYEMMEGQVWEYLLNSLKTHLESRT